MPAAVAIPLIVGAASTGATLYAAHKSASAAKDAAKTQSDAATKAADYTQANTDKALQYIMGQQGTVRSPMQTSPAYARMYQGLGLGQPFQQQYGGGGSPIAQDGMVTLQAPNGLTKAVPASQADHFVSLGARRI
jgi:hypothetical protein